MIFGKMVPEIGKTEMIRCITARQLWEHYFLVTSPPVDVYQPTQGRWLLVTSLDETTFISPTTLLICLKNLRTVVEFDDFLCFHLEDIYRGKFLSQHWLQLIAIVFCRQAKIHILDQTYTPEKPITVLEAHFIVHDWSCNNMGDRPLRRTVWQDRRAIFEHLAPQPTEPRSNSTGKWLITQPGTRANYRPWITYANTDILQASGAVVFCCPADLVFTRQRRAMSFEKLNKTKYSD